jgi:hypothetical protein
MHYNEPSILCYRYCSSLLESNLNVIVGNSDMSSYYNIKRRRQTSKFSGNYAIQKNEQRLKKQVVGVAEFQFNMKWLRH